MRDGWPPDLGAFFVDPSELGLRVYGWVGTEGVRRKLEEMAEERD